MSVYMQCILVVLRKICKFTCYKFFSFTETLFWINGFITDDLWKSIFLQKIYASLILYVYALKTLESAELSCGVAARRAVVETISYFSRCSVLFSVDDVLTYRIMVETHLQCTRICRWLYKYVLECELILLHLLINAIGLSSTELHRSNITAFSGNSVEFSYQGGFC